METAQHLRQVDDLARIYPDVPAEAIFKEDMLRTGIDFSDEALALASGFKPKSYFIFSFDRLPLTELPRREDLRAPEEVALVGGARGLRRTIVSVRLNPESPYRVEVRDGGLALRLEEEDVCGIELQESPPYYARTLSSGKPMTEMAPTIEWGYLIYLTVYRKCQYFGFKEECHFCDINENFRQQKAAGRPYQTVKEPAEILEALAIIDAEDCERHTKAYTLTGGSIIRGLRGLEESEFYGRYAFAIQSRFPGRWISKVVTQALPIDSVRLLRDAGVQIYHPNYEIWDRELFARLCPGKERHVGWGEWVRRIVEAGRIFGPSRVVPNFVAGVEMARPHGFATSRNALASTGEGLDYFMSRGIVPRFTTWCPEPLSALGRSPSGRDGGPAPLEYHVGLLRLWRETLQRHGLPAPPGYGEAGAGRAVFSVSAFLDALPAEWPVAEV